MKYIFLVGLALTLGVGCFTDVPKKIPVETKAEPTPEPEQTTTSKPVIQTITPEADILFVIDNSGSMGSHQMNLSNNIDQFIAELAKNKGLDWRIAVTTTNMERMWPGSHGKFYGSPTVISKTTPNFLNALKNNLKPGANGDLGLETVFEPIETALSPSMLAGFNKGFYRPSANLTIIIITDADDQGNNPPSATLDFLYTLKNQQKSKISVYAALANLSPICQSSEPSPIRLLDFIKISGGSSFTLCGAELGKKVVEIGQDITKKVDAFIFLDRRPKPETIEVLYGTVKVPSDPINGWLYDFKENVIKFGPKFNYDSQPAGTQFTVSFIPAAI